jgi:mono/diheme cytochrome c family protein
LEAKAGGERRFPPVVFEGSMHQHRAVALEDSMHQHRAVTLEDSMHQHRVVTLEDSMQRPRVLALGLAFAIACVVSASAIAQMSGPMSSGYKPNTAQAQAQPSTDQAPPVVGKDEKGLDVNKLFAGTCGWCHSNGGRTAGKGPKLAGTTLTDAEIANRIKNGKPGAMPAFGSAFSDDDIKAIVRYIRDLKES